jgi:hypothetical protein
MMGTRSLSKSAQVSFSIPVLLVVCAVPAAADEKAVPPDEPREAEAAQLEKIGMAFVGAARKASPAVVFIQAEKNVLGNTGVAPFNDPFEMFNREFFRRFFGPDVLTTRTIKQFERDIRRS